MKQNWGDRIPEEATEGQAEMYGSGLEFRTQRKIQEGMRAFPPCGGKVGSGACRHACIP